MAQDIRPPRAWEYAFGVATVPAGLGVLQIEPTDHCNLACAMCAPHAERWETVHGVPKGYLDIDLYTRILRGLVADDCRFDHLILQWLGDPSLHPRLEDLVALAGTHLQGRVGHLRVDTNGILLGPERVERLLARRVPEVPLLLVFTLDAVTPETYRATKGRDGLERARRHVRHLLALRRRLPDPGSVRVQLQFVVQPSNHFEAGAFLDYWTRALDCVGDRAGHGEILFKRLAVGGGAAGQAAADRLYESTLRAAGIRPEVSDWRSVTVWADRPWQRDDAHSARGPCPGPWYTPVIRHDGHLLLCCSDLRGELDLGSLAEHGFRELWEGPKAQAVRLAHLDGRFEGVCAGCGGINWYRLGEGVAEATRAGRPFSGAASPAPSPAGPGPR